jgi:hypothetical protein
MGPETFLVLDTLKVWCFGHVEFLNNASWASVHFRLYSRIFILRYPKFEYMFLHFSRGHTELKHSR